MDEWTKSEKEYFEEVSPRRLRALEKEYIWHYPNVSFLLGRIGERARCSPGDRLTILEVGCGPAVSTRRYFRGNALNPFYLGLDISAVMLAPAARAFPEGYFVQCDLSVSLPLKGAAFDFILSLGVLHHLENFPVSLRKLSELLRPGGEILLQEPNPHAFRFWNGSSPRERSVAPEEVAAAARDCGLEMVSAHRVNSPIFLRFRLWMRRLKMGIFLRPRAFWWMKHRLEVLWEPLGGRFPMLRGMNTYYILKKLQTPINKSQAKSKTQTAKTIGRDFPA